MYFNLYRGLNLKPEDLTTYDSPLLGFDRKVVLRGQIRLPASKIRGGRGGFHCGGCLLFLHSHCSKTLASCLGGYFLHPSFESEIFV